MMVKLKLVFSIIFLLTVQQVSSSLPLNELSFPVQEDNQIESCVELIDSLPEIFGDMPSGIVVDNFAIAGTDCFAGNFKSKDVQSGLTFPVAMINLKFSLAQSSAFTRYSAVSIPGLSPVVIVFLIESRNGIMPFQRYSFN